MQNSTSTPQNPLVGITHGDFNSTGYEIILKAYADLRLLSVVTPLLYGQSKIFSYYKKNFGMEEFNYSLTRDARQTWNQKFNILNIVEHELKIDPGIPTELSGEMAVKSLKMASDDLRNGFLDALVLTPANPSTMKSDKYAFNSQMNFLASALEMEMPLLMAVSDRLKIGMATSHIPLSKVPEMITKDLVSGKLKVFSDTLKKDFGINAPKVAVLGLNPHAGGFGLFGEEDEKVIKVAVDEARSKGLYAFGPFAADSFFLSDAWCKYDAVLAMYHDQAMLPFNLLSVDAGAYYLAGSQFVCTAPVADCDFEHCNQNIASDDAFRKALYLACDILKHRKGE
ncbi:MAG: 4-hydroxythreonine-4-phosphate dehydrogenase PdxA [bacterium]|nr:4-hydroxythreonine-4-phosphate dehydrogenase PdxA [Candidatus Limimorpha equi]